MKVGVAQIKPVAGDVSQNIDKHKKLIDFAVSLEADALFFPELSLTGYEPKLARGLSMSIHDKLLDDFQVLSDSGPIAIGLGLPVQTDNKPYISMVLFQANQARQAYFKQQLHIDELLYFKCGKEQIIIDVKDTKVALAICYESLQPSHVENAVSLGADIYVASVAKDVKGMERAFSYYSEISNHYSMPVLVSNHIDFYDDFEGCGKSAFWSETGKLLGQLNSSNEGVLIFDTNTKQINERYL